MLSLIKKLDVKLILKVVVIGVTVFFCIKAVLLYIPKKGSYSEQKEYAREIYNRANRASNTIFFIDPQLMIKEMGKKIFGATSWRKGIRAHKYMLKKYTEKAKKDVDIFGRLGDLYYGVYKYDKAIEAYQKQLDLFKERYFKKEYPEKKGIAYKKVRVEEFRYVVRVQYSIARCYNKQKKYEKQLEEYNKILAYLPQAEGMDEFKKADIFERTFESKGRLYKLIFKDYDKARGNYRQMRDMFSEPLFRSRAIIYIGDTYLAEGNIEKAREIYQMVVEAKSDDLKEGAQSTARNRLKGLEKGEIRATDGVAYIIKDGKVTVKDID